MAVYVTKVRTDVGDIKIDYNALANLPKSDTTLSQSGEFADAKVVGEKITSVSDELNSVHTELKVEVSKKAETSVFTGVFAAGGWSNSLPYTQTLTITGILPTDNPFVDVNLSDVVDALPILEEWTYVGRVTASEVDTIVGYCYEEKPTIDIPIILKVVR